MTGEDSAAWWNPMDTTLKVGGATPYNSFGPDGAYHVWNYDSAVSGIDATVATLKQSNMAAFSDAMKQAHSTALSLARAFAHTPWGGIGDYLPLEIVQNWENGTRNHVIDRQQIVHGEGPWPYKTDGTPMG